MSSDPYLNSYAHFALNLNARVLSEDAVTRVIDGIRRLLIEEGALTVGQRPATRPVENDDTLVAVERTRPLTPREFIALEPAKTFPRLNCITEKQRGPYGAGFPTDHTICRAGALFTYVSKDVTMPNVAEQYFLWSKALYRTRKTEVPIYCRKALPWAVDRLEALLDSPGFRSIKRSELKSRMYRIVHISQLVWNLRRADNPTCEKVGGMPDKGVAIRNDGLGRLVRFFVSEDLIEFVDDDHWLIIGPGQAVLMVRSSTRTDDQGAGGELRRQA